MLALLPFVLLVTPFHRTFWGAMLATLLAGVNQFEHMPRTKIVGILGSGELVIHALGIVAVVKSNVQLKIIPINVLGHLDPVTRHVISSLLTGEQ